MKIKHKDKYLHIVAGAGISVLFLAIWILTISHATPVGVVTAVWLSWIVGTAKEFYDEKHNGVKDGWDAQSTTLGGLIGVTAVLLVMAVILLV